MSPGLPVESPTIEAPRGRLNASRGGLAESFFYVHVAHDDGRESLSQSRGPRGGGLNHRDDGVSVPD
jgi:hypothetical protein